ncbi:MAG: serine hydrolase domain-containing protein [Thermodesulfobacteriota bacterium]
MKKTIAVCAVLGIALPALTGMLLLPKDYDIPTMLRSAPIGTGYAAKMLCSAVFVSGRNPASVWREELELMHRNWIRGRIDYDRKSVDAYALGFLFKRTAVYRGDCGCTLDLGSPADDSGKNRDKALPVPPAGMETEPWPLGDMPTEDPPPSGIDRGLLERTLDWAFSESHPEHPVRTRAVMVLYDGRIVAERYADGYSKDSRLLGWSMTKSVTSALIGLLVRDGLLDIRKPAGFPEWSGPGDPRSAITIDQLLRMSSGLSFQEDYEEQPDSDAGFMYFTVPDMAAFAARKPPEARPDEEFHYSSGTTMLLSRIIRETLEKSDRDHRAFPRRELFHRLGMRSAVVEHDPSGTMVGAGFMYATLRDWARFGLLFYDDGFFCGERILPEGWVRYCRTPTPTFSGYGAQFWLNGGGRDRWLPDCPEDLYSARGHEGQYVTIVPSRKTVIVRLGHTVDEEIHWNHNYFVSNILEAMPDETKPDETITGN